MDPSEVIERDNRPAFDYHYFLFDEEPNPSPPRSRKDGYQVERFTTHPPNEYICIVCMGVVRDPLECINCGVLMCSKCVHGYMESRRRTGILGMRAMEFACPTCRHQTEPRTPSRILLEIINEMELTCKHKEEGCREVRSLRDIKAHEKECSFKVIKCTYCEVKGSKEEFKAVADRSEAGQRVTYACSIACERTVMFQHLIKENRKDEAIKLYFTFLKEAGGSPKEEEGVRA